MDIREDIREDIRKALDIREHIMVQGHRDGRREGLREGRKEGRQEGRQDIAFNMLEKKLDIPLISEVTGVSKKEIKKLRNRDDIMDIREHIRAKGHWHGKKKA